LIACASASIGFELVWADAGYNAHQAEHAAAAQPPLRVEIVKRPADSSGFIVSVI
jgi:hypothetical protein